MKGLMIVLALVLFTGCAVSTKHSKYCVTKKGADYSTCYHEVKYVTEPACVGSCQTKP